MLVGLGSNFTKTANTMTKQMSQPSLSMDIHTETDRRIKRRRKDGWLYKHKDKPYNICRYPAGMVVNNLKFTDWSNQ